MWCRPTWLSVEAYGLVLVFWSAVFYALAGAFVKLGHIHGLPSTELVFARGIFQGSLVVLGLCICKDAKGQRLIAHPFGKSAEAQKLVWMRGIIGGAGFLLDYHCMSVLPLGDAMTLMSLYPFVTIVLARIFLNEAIQPLHLATTVASVTGAVLIGQPTFLFGGETAPRLGYVTGLLGSVCLASILIFIRKAGKIGVHTFQLLLSWALFGILFSVVIGPSYEGAWKWPSSGVVWGYVLGVCIVGAGCHFLLNFAGRLAPAGLVSVVRASDIVWAYCLEIGLFEQKPNKFTWMGVALILGSLLAIGIEKIYEAQTNPQVPSPKAATNERIEAIDESPLLDEESQEVVQKSSKDE